VELVIWVVASNVVLGILACLFGWSKTATAAATALRIHLQVLVGRSWGTYHRFLRGAYLDSGEHELFRSDIHAISVYAIDGYTEIGHDSTCLVTDHRLVICDPTGTMLEIPLITIRSTRASREYDPDSGFTYSVAIDRGDTRDHNPHGDIWLRCASDRQSHDLASSIHDAVDHMMPQVGALTPE
jgi:hypothetical protein